VTAPSFHPLADLFPLMEGADFDALVNDIKEHGLREPILLFEDQILDGRNRSRACEQANVEPIYQDWISDGAPQAFVVSKNLHRRHLNESQRAMVAAKLATRKRQDSLIPGGIYAKKLDGQIPTSSGMAQQEAADLLNVSRSSLVDAKIVQREGSADDIKAVEQGVAAVSTVAKQIREKVPPKARAKQRAESKSQVGKNPERIQKQQINAEIWGRIRESLTHLTSLPLPADVAAIARTNDKTGLVDARLSKATRWLKEFSDAWHGQ
jgi:hypothetical protein